MGMNGIGEAGLGDHICWVYQDDESFRHVVTSYIADGLFAGQRVVCFMAEDALPVAAAVQADPGSLVLAPFKRGYLPDGRFDPDARLAGFELMAHRALADGFTGLRVLGHATAMLDDPVPRDAWPSYELRADLLISRMPIVGLCAFDARSCHPDGLQLLQSVHSHSLGEPAGESLFRLHGQADGSLSVEGEIDFAAAPVVERLAGDACRDLLVPELDLSGLRFIDGAGMRAVVKGIRSIAASHSRVRVRGTGPMFKRLWTLLECDKGIESEVVLV